MKYQHLFFDLDHTLWDYESNFKETIRDLYQAFDLQSIGTFDDEMLIEAFRQHNRELWRKFESRETTKEEILEKRFDYAFQTLGLHKPDLAYKLSMEFEHRSLQKAHKVAYTDELLSYLHGRYVMHIITNGFKEQNKKLVSSGIDHYFDQIITSDCANATKPDYEIFRYALSQANARPEHSLMIGDNPNTDIKGALEAGIDAVYFNIRSVEAPLKPTYEIKCLSELFDLL